MPSLPLVLKTDLPGIKLFKRGKVRDLYDLEDQLLIVTTDRISAFDCVLPNGIPYKGKVLTGLSEFWFNFTRQVIPNHLIATEEENFPQKLASFKNILRGRSMLVKKSKVIEIECIVRGYLAGSAYREYKKTRSIYGIKLPSGLRETDPLPEPIFTPAIKVSRGHDVNITRERMEEMIGRELSERLEEVSLKIYYLASQNLESRGFILCDTKLEFGIHEGKVILIDELLTPDSSRFWSRKMYRPGHPQVSFDKQFLRNYLEGLDWDKTPPAPFLSPEVVRKTSEKYLEAYQRITGKRIDS